jgi:UDP-N-acetylglucosamine acyltransferase
MAAGIHPTAIIDSRARIGREVSIGPYTVIEGDVEIGDRSVIGPHVVIAEYTRIGRECRIFSGANIGQIPQDVKFAGEKSFLRIGDRTTIREFCTLNRGTAASGETVIGNDSLLLAYCHVGHDCVIGDHFISSNNLAMAGHVRVGSNVTIGGVCAIHQFTKIGDYCMIGAYSWVTQDVVPYALTAFDPVRVIDINRVKLERCNFAPERTQEIRRAFRVLFRSGLQLDAALSELTNRFPGNEDVDRIIAFARVSTRGLLRMQNNRIYK